MHTLGWSKTRVPLTSCRHPLSPYSGGAFSVRIDIGSGHTSPILARNCVRGTYCGGGYSQLSTGIEGAYVCPMRGRKLSVSVGRGEPGRNNLDICHITGTYSTAVGATSSVTCTPCTSTGFYCPMGSSSTAGILCPAGFYCAGAASDKQACPTNATSPRGSTAVTNCSCNAGSWGPPGGTCTLCPAGTFSAAVGAASNSTCEACPPGTFSSGANSSASVRNHPYIYIQIYVCMHVCMYM